MILTKKGPNQFLLTAESEHLSAALQDGDDRIVIMTRKGWHTLRELTPEARALKELVEALEGCDEDTRAKISKVVASVPELTSAVQEARVVVARMDNVGTV